METKFIFHKRRFTQCDKVKISIHPFCTAMIATAEFKICFAPLILAEVYDLADNAANGAVVMMSGMVRDQTDGQPVEYLEYQAYEPMALKVFEQIGQEVRQQWPIATKVIIHHRIGKLRVGEISVLVAVGAPHRGEAFAACQYAIDTLKHNAPIWKKEHWSDGSSSWVSIGACEELHQGN